MNRLTIIMVVLGMIELVLVVVDRAFSKRIKPILAGLLSFLEIHCRRTLFAIPAIMLYPQYGFLGIMAAALLSVMLALALTWNIELPKLQLFPAKDWAGARAKEFFLEKGVARTFAATTEASFLLGLGYVAAKFSSIPLFIAGSILLHRIYSGIVALLFVFVIEYLIEKKEKDEPAATVKTEDGERCGFCYGGGTFGDFDSDFSYGLPVCPGCGGLGRIYASEKFEALRKDIFRLRFEYCPIGEDISAEEKTQKLKELIEAVQKIYEEFGNGRKNSYTKELIDRYAK